MAKKRRIGARRYIAKARRAYKKSGFGGVIGAAVKGVGYALVAGLSGMIPVAGLSVQHKRWIALAVMYLVGGKLRTVATFGIGVEVAMVSAQLIAKYLPSMFGGQAQVQIQGAGL